MGKNEDKSLEQSGVNQEEPRVNPSPSSWREGDATRGNGKTGDVAGLRKE